MRVTLRFGHVGPPGTVLRLPGRPSDWGQHLGHAGACVWASGVAGAASRGRASRLLDLRGDGGRNHQALHQGRPGGSRSEIRSRKFGIFQKSSIQNVRFCRILTLYSSRGLQGPRPRRLMPKHVPSMSPVAPPAIGPVWEAGGPRTATPESPKARGTRIVQISMISGPSNKNITICRTYSGLSVGGGPIWITWTVYTHA